MKRIKYIFQGFFQYLKNPHYTERLEGFNQASFIETNILFIAKYVLSIGWVLTINKWLRAYFDIERSEIATSEEQSLIQLFFVVTFAYPIVEEFLFRFWIRSKQWVMLIIICLSVALSSYWLLKGIAMPSLMMKRIVLVAVPLILIGIITGLYRHQSKTGSIDQTIKKGFPIIFYLSILLFGLLHAFNFDTPNALVPLLMIMPQFIAGAFFGYVRMKFGMWAALYIHMLGNATTFVFSELLGW